MKRGCNKPILLFFTLNSILVGTSLNSTNVYAKDRLYGNDRYDTSAEICKEGWQEKADCIVIASGEDFPDALSAAPLAKYKNAPLLLTSKDSLKTSVLKEIKRLNPKEVIIVGGDGVVSDKIFQQIKKETSIKSLRRIAGRDRYETSLKIAEELGEVKDIAIVSGKNFPDALSISSIAAQKKIPILLVQPDYIKPETLNYINKIKNLENKYIIGGDSVVSKDKVEKKLGDVKRLYGKDRFSTNLSVLKEFKNNIVFNKIYVARGIGKKGNEFADALAGAPLAGRNREAVILTDDNISKDITEFIKKEGTPKSEVVLLGGEAVVKDKIKNDLNIKGTESKKIKELDKFQGNIYMTDNNEKLEYKDIEGNLYIEKEGCNINNTKIKGTIYVKTKGKVTLENVEADKIVLLNDEDNILNIKESKANEINIACKNEAKSEINILEGNSINKVNASSSAKVRNKRESNTKIEVVNSSQKNKYLELDGDFKEEIKIKSEVNIKSEKNSSVENLNIETKENEKVSIDGKFKNIFISSKTNVEIKDNSEISNIKSNESSKGSKIIAKENVKVGVLDKNLDLHGKISKLEEKPSGGQGGNGSGDNKPSPGGNEGNKPSEGEGNGGNKPSQGDNTNDDNKGNKELKASYKVDL